MNRGRSPGPAGRWKRLFLVGMEFLLVVTIIYSVHLWRTRDLLPDRGLAAVPTFDLVDLQGERWTEASLSDRTTVLYFFSPGCGVCNASAHQLRWFHRWFGDDIRLVLVVLDWSSVAEVQSYVERHDLDLPVLMGDIPVARRFRVPGYPTYYVISGHRILRRDFGYTTVIGLWWRSVLWAT